MNKFSYKW